MFGRDRELAQLSGGIRAAQLARLTAQLVVGEAGIGKTTLLAAALSSVPKGIPVVVCRADELDQGVPYSLLVELIDRWTAATGGDAGHVRELTDLLDASRSLDSADYAFEIARWMREFVKNGQHELFVLSFEDIHNLDDGSLRLLGQLIRALRDVPIAMVFTSRLGYDKRIGDLKHLFTRMGKYGAAEVIALGPLTDDVVASIASNVSPEPVESRAIRQLIEATAGNPFLVEQYVALMKRDRMPTLDQSGSGDRLPDGTHPRVPGAQIIVERFFPVLGAPWVLAGVLSLFRGPVHINSPIVEELARAQGLDPDAQALAWDALVSTGVLRAEGTPGTFLFIHPIVSDVLYESMGAGERMLAHRQIAEALDSDELGSRRVFDVATHYLLSSGSEPDLRAADASLRAAAVAEESASSVAALWLRRCLDLMPPGDARRSMTYLRLLYALVAIWALREAEDVARRAEEEFSEFPESLWIALPAAMTYLLTGQAERSSAILATIQLDGLGEEFAFWVNAHKTIGLYHAGDSQHAVEAHAECRLVELEVNPETAPASAFSYASLTAYELLTGQVDDYERHFRRTLATVPLIPSANRREVTGTLAYLDLLGPGRVAEVTDLLAATYDRPLDDSELGLLGPSSATAWMLIHWLRGNVSLAQRIAHLNVQEMEREGAGMMLAGARAVEVLLLSELGSLKEARTAGAKLVWGPAGNNGLVALARSRLMELDGSADDSVRVLEQFLREAREVGVVPSVTSVAEELVRLHLAEGRVTQAREVADEAYRRTAHLDWPLQSMFALRARGRAYEDVSQVEQARDISAELELGYESLTCELVMAGLGDSPKERLTRALSGFREIGAFRSERLARAEFRRLGLRVPRAKPEPVHATGELTDSERQVAQLAAQGLTNRQIADALFVSTKTVELYLSRVFVKKGVRGRVELTAKLLGERSTT